MNDQVKIENGKYTFLCENGKLSCLRFGEKWVEDFNVPGAKALIVLFYTVEKQRKALEFYGDWNNYFAKSGDTHLSVMDDDQGKIAREVLTNGLE